MKLSRCGIARPGSSKCDGRTSGNDLVVAHRQHMRATFSLLGVACALFALASRAASGAAASGQAGAGAEGNSQSVEMAKTLANPIGNLISVPWWTVPVNGVVQQLVKIGKRPVAFSLGGRYCAERPAEGPHWGLRFAVIFLFPK